MEHNTADFVAQLEQATQNLLYMSENDFPFRTVVFETNEVGEFTLENFLGVIEVLLPEHLSDLLNYVSDENNYIAYNNYGKSPQVYVNPESATEITKKMEQKYSNLISFLQSKLKKNTYLFSR